MNLLRKKRVVVAMSGGVDSSATAYVLKKEGYDVVGMTMRVFKNPKGEAPYSARCCSPQDIYDARRVADHLKIPFYVVDLKDVFKREVVDYFVLTYAKGMTPNPCIVCNSKIKFGHLLRRALEIEADYLATGHYARIGAKAKMFSLYKGKDAKKDQSYFLFDIKQNELKKLLFPLGGLLKRQVRKIAQEAGLQTAQKHESQEICFVEEGKYCDFVESRLEADLLTRGDFVNLKGKVLGRHGGIHRYTVGQRRGLGISHSRPLYVISINNKEGTVTLGENEDLYAKELIADRFTWVKEKPPRGAIKAKIRYNTPEAASFISGLSEERYKVTFEKPQRGITPGQACVLYRGDEVLGGGWIES